MKYMVLSLFVTFVIAFSESAMSFNIDADDIKNMKINKQEVMGTLDLLVSTGQITKRDADAAKAKLRDMDDSDLDKYKEQAIKVFENNGAVPGGGKPIDIEKFKHDPAYKNADSVFKQNVDAYLKELEDSK